LSSSREVARPQMVQSPPPEGRIIKSDIVLTQTAPKEAVAPLTRSMRVAFALSGLHRVTRGAEVAFEEVARQIAIREGMDVTLIGSGPFRPGMPYRYKQAACIPREYFEKWPSLPYVRDHYSYEELSFVPGLWRAFSPRDFDVTVTCGYPYTNWMLRAGRRAGQPKHVFVTQNGDWMVQARNWEYRHFSCDGLICTNPEYFERHQNRYPCALIPNGVDPNVFCPGEANRAALGLPENPVVLMVSALASFKRVLEGIRAVALVPDACLVIAGDGEQRREVEQLGNQLMPGRFRRLTLPRPEMPGLYRSADVFLHMSQDEPSANAYIEALATGLPIVTHDRYVTRWTLEDQAVLVDTSDASAVREGIARAMDFRKNSDVRARRNIVERRFAWSAIAKDYCDFFASLS
jgi:glycosyltransferase involved in cell wall biosynthesis